MFHSKKKMRKSIILILFLILMSILNSSIIVDYGSELPSESIQTEMIDDVEYFKVNELNKIFRARIKENLLDQRLYVNMYGQEMIFLLDSAYLFYQNEIYNFNQPIISRKGKYLIPVFFLENVLPQLYPKQIQFNTNFISAELPIDNSIHRIVLDPGHGGKDPGAVGYSKKNYEKDVALAVARKLKRILLEQMSVEVYLTREKDEFVSLQKRTKFANEKKADLFISIHCNAARKKTANGIEVYFLSTAKTDDARAVEALENDVVFKYEGGEEAVKQYDDLAFILADMAQSEYLEESYNLSMRLQNDLIRTTESRDRGVKQANFYVLRGAFMPAVLIELGFLSNKEEEKKLTKSSYQNKLAQSIYESIRDFKKKYDQLN